MIEATGLNKRYGSTVAVDGLTFSVPPGQVTGFLGPNGAGKSTTMRLILGLDAPTAGIVTVAGRLYRSLRRPLLTVGALLDARAVHGGRSARDHLLAIALSNGIARGRVRDVLELVGLQRVAGTRAGGFSLGMLQRLGIAAALLGDPPVLMFDEPVNGLDPDGVLWIRTLLKALAAEGRTVFLSSHLMSEMSQTADRLIIIGRGSLIAQGTLAEVLSSGSPATVRVRSPDAVQLGVLLDRRGAAVHTQPDGSLQITGTSAEHVGEIARAHGLALQELSIQQTSLEDRYMELTRDAVDYRSDEHRTEPVS